MSGGDVGGEIAKPNPCLQKILLESNPHLGCWDDTRKWNAGFIFAVARTGVLDFSGVSILFEAGQ